MALKKVLVATLAAQAAIVSASLVFPVLAPTIAGAANLPLHFVGYYSGIIYGIAMASSLATPALLQRFGGIHLHQWMLALTATALLLLLVPNSAFLLCSALVLGAAYGPANPASTAMLALHTPPQLRGRIFSLKQTAVPIGGALAASAVPALAVLAGWRVALLVVAAFCGILALLIGRWRNELDKPNGLTSDEPTVRPSTLKVLLGNNGLRAVAFAFFSFGATQFSFSSVFPAVLSLAGWNESSAGLVVAFALVISVVCRVALGAVADRLGLRRVLAALGAVMSVTSFAAISIDSTSSPAKVATIAAFFGLSAFCWAGIGVAEAIRHVPPSAVSQATAAVIALTFAGALVGPALFSTIGLLAGGFGLAFLVMGLMTFAVTVWLVFSEPEDVK